MILTFLQPLYSRPCKCRASTAEKSHERNPISLESQIGSIDSAYLTGQPEPAVPQALNDDLFLH